MVRYILQQIKITSHKCYGKWFAKNVVEETFDLDDLAEHMSNHNSPYSKGVIKGLLTDMIQCIKELLLEGKNVKIDDLAIFSLGIKNKVMADTEEDFTVSKNISGVKLKARATGELMSKSLNLEATLKKATYINGKLTTSDSSVSGSGSSTGTSDPATDGDSSNTNSGDPANTDPTNSDPDNQGGGGNDDNNHPIDTGD
jgi:predicted histone-like DNA-binding protein